MLTDCLKFLLKIGGYIYESIWRVGAIEGNAIYLMRSSFWFEMRHNGENNCLSSCQSYLDVS